MSTLAATGLSWPRLSGGSSSVLRGSCATITPNALVAGRARPPGRPVTSAGRLARRWQRNTWPAMFAIDGFDFDLHAEVRDHQAGAVRAQVAALKCLDGRGLAFGGAGGALALNLFDAPVLTTIELAFGHGCSVSRMQRLGKTASEFSTPGHRPRLNCAALPRSRHMQNPQNLISMTWK